MTQETIWRLMRAQLKKAQKVLQEHICDDGKRGSLEDLEREIGNTLAVIDAEVKNVKRG